MRRDSFQGIADPTRRDIILLLSKTDLSINKVAERFNISRPAVSKHVKILKECGLVEIRQQGRERYCRLNTEPLKEVFSWLEYFSEFWDERLDSLKTYLEAENEQ